MRDKLRPASHASAGAVPEAPARPLLRQHHRPRHPRAHAGPPARPGRCPVATSLVFKEVAGILGMSVRGLEKVRGLPVVWVAHKVRRVPRGAL